MIAAWMVYSVAVSLLLVAGATAGEFVARALGVPARIIWCGAIVGALGLSTAALVAGTRQRTDIAPISEAGPLRITSRTLTDPAGATLPAPAAVAPHTALLQRLVIAAEGSVTFLRTAAARIDLARLEPLNTALVVLWIAASGVAVGWFTVSLAHLRRIERGLEPVIIDNHPVLVSSDIGPALLGIVRTRVVIPRWVLSLSDVEREIIFTHEREHARAFDPALLYAAALALVLQPWNAGLWLAFARLRLALEVDCDRRVLAVTRDARQYGALLIQVYERTTPGLTPYIAFVERPSNLERRIRRIARRPRVLSLAGAAATVGALVLTSAAWSVAAPRRPSTALVASPGMPARQSPGVRRPLPVITLAAANDALPVVTMAADKTVIDSIETTVPTVPRRAGSGPCPFGVRPNGTERTAPSSFPIDCSMDGDAVLVVLDSARVLVAFHDSTDAQMPRAGYMIFTVKGGGLPRGLRWYSSAGHAEFHGTDMLVANPSANVPAIAMMSVAENARYPGALQFVIDGVEVLKRPAITWDILRQLPTAARCTSTFRGDTLVINRGGGVDTAPLFIVDGVVTSGDLPRRDCFIVGGQQIFLT